MRFAGLAFAATLLVSAAAPLLAQNLAALSPDGKWAAYASDGALWVISTRKAARPRKVATFPDAYDAYMTVPRWSPVGDQLAYYSSGSGTLQLWLYDVRVNRSRRISFVKGGIDPPGAAYMGGFASAPLRYSWSPDGSTIVFSNRESISPLSGHASDQSRPTFPSAAQLQAGVPVVLTDTTPAAWTLYGVVSYGHTPVSTYVDAGVRRSVPELRPAPVVQLFLLHVRSGRVTQLTHDGDGYFTPEWSPDGKRIAYMSAGGTLPDRATVETDIFILDLASGRKRQITHGRTQKTLPLWSPDGKWIAYYGYDRQGTFARRKEAVYRVAADGSGQSRSISGRLDRHITAFEWAPRGVAILVAYRNGVATPLVRIDIRTSVAHRISPAGAAIDAYGMSFGTSRSGTLWAQLTDPNGATALWFRGTHGQARRLVDVEPARDLRHKRRYAVVHWTNRQGDALDGLLVYPLHYNKESRYPLIVDAYGDGAMSIVRDYGQTNYVKAAPGDFVFRPNHRAPHMWLNGVRSPVYDAAAVGPTGVAAMADDIMSGVDQLVARGLVDPNRMCLAGFSNGGLEAEQLLTRVHRFKCAVLQSPASGNWLNSVFLGYTADAIHFMYGIAPWQDPSIYTALTPLFHANRITTPILLAAGDREPLIIPTVETYKVLRFLHKPVTLLRYATQGHGFKGAAEADFTKRIAAFFKKYLGAKPRGSCKPAGAQAVTAGAVGAHCPSQVSTAK